MSIGGMTHRTSYVSAALLAAALLLVIVALAGNSSPHSAEAATSTLNPVKDNTLYEYFAADGDRSNGAGDRFFAGKTDQGRIRRGVLAFNIAGAILTAHDHERHPQHEHVPHQPDHGPDGRTA
jgi:hypothetical protein